MTGMGSHLQDGSVKRHRHWPSAATRAGAVAFSLALLAGFAWLGGAPLAAVSASAACIVEEERCSCATSRDPEVQHVNWVERAELIVRARVVATDTLMAPPPDPVPPGWPGHPIVARLAVDELWKGTVEEGILELELTHTHRRTSCDLQYDVGTEILLYARRHPDTGRWMSSICSGTLTIARAHTRGDLDRLGPGLRPGD